MCNWIITCLLTFVTLLPALSLTVQNVSADEKTAFTAEDEDYPVDFSEQGEYAGTVDTDEGKITVGIQLVARGNREYVARVFPGGLPGDGADLERVIEAKGKLVDGKIIIRDDETVTVGVLKNNVIHVREGGVDGKEVGQLNPVERKSPTLGAEPPEGAIVLFDGTSGDNFKNGRVSSQGTLMQGVTSKQTFKDIHLHVEFQLPFMPFATSQQRGNSGCYLQGRYEVQMLDSFGLEGKDNECGGIYGVKAPDLNMCLPPLTWQTYDIDFTAPVFDDEGNKTKNATLTVRHNGVVVQDNVEVEGPTRAAPFQESNDPGPLYLQDHSNPVRYRNIWYVEK